MPILRTGPQVTIITSDTPGETGGLFPRTDGQMNLIYGTAAANLFKQILAMIPGEDANREGLQETPQRVADAWFDELLSGYGKDPKEVMKTFESTQNTGLTIVKDIPVYSLCEHHCLPIFGVAHIAYIPNGRVLGLSKFKRVLDIYARRLQVQERLTAQVADALKDGLEAKGIMVIIEARHMCMELRGVQTAGSTTITSELRGLFRDVTALRDEAMALIRGAK